ncbi:ATP-dependent Clp protease proteolytic subunit [Microbacterium sp. ISL-103]|uniref:ClpP family protease n=1 Tax=Microbacterium sp. ISL-103 TaxID=2819156 RepID=UPI001BE4F352|nr:ATP-dependent Clp protease proteolytic subunit [Microbacterium sp. ISL-103]MBT2474782.1 ATP-dependent Clp protease proteolytic subunit [Microbacterium sp. ISL-103]
MSGYTIPNVIAQHPRGDRVMDVYSHLLAERVIYLGTAIDAGVANALIAQLLHLDADNQDSGIQFYINSEGGDPGAALAIYDTMQHIRPTIATTCVGQAIGPAALLVAAGTSGQRAALAHARIVLHQPAGQSRGAIPDLILAADEVVRVRGDMEAILARHSGRSLSELRADTDRDRVFTASAALDYGLIDTVLGERAA